MSDYSQHSGMEDFNGRQYRSYDQSSSGQYSQGNDWADQEPIIINDPYHTASGQQAGALSDRHYYALITGFIAWGFIVNLVMHQVASKAIFSFVSKNYLVFLIGTLVLTFAGSIVANKENTIVAFIGYHMILIPIGMILSISVSLYDPLIVRYAFTGAIAITIGMTIIGLIMPQAFLSLGKTLLVSLGLTITVELIMMLCGLSTGIIDFVVIGIMAMYIGYDVSRAQVMDRTVHSALHVAIELYMDIINLALRLMRILGRSRN